jgi:hypothetical protein
MRSHLTLITAFFDSCFAANIGKMVRAAEALGGGKDEAKFLDTLKRFPPI